MTIDELYSDIAKRAGKTKKEVALFYDAFLESFKDQAIADLKNSEDKIKITLPKIGNFTVKMRDAYMGKNPRTKEVIEIAKMKRLTFKPFDSFKEFLNGAEPKEEAKAPKAVTKKKNTAVKKVIKKKKK